VVRLSAGDEYPTQADGHGPLVNVRSRLETKGHRGGKKPLIPYVASSNTFALRPLLPLVPIRWNSVWDTEPFWTQLLNESDQRPCRDPNPRHQDNRE
jgi:hypothetical protein